VWKGGDVMGRSFMEWFLALLRRDMKEYPIDRIAKDTLFQKIKKKK